MNNFTQLLSESAKAVSNVLTIEDLNEYIEKTSKKLPSIVRDALYLLKKYIILRGDDINEIVSTSKNGLDKIAIKYNISSDSLGDLWKILKDLKSNIRLLPHFMNTQERDSFIKGKLRVEDITIDLTTSQGRNDVVKMYMPLIYKIVNQYVGKSKLNKSDLISAAEEGFVEAMKDWDRSKHSTFKTYVSYRVQQRILNNIDKYSRIESTGKSFNWYAAKTAKGNISLDKLSDDGDNIQDRLGALAIDDNDYDYTIDRDEEKQWKYIYNIIEKKFKQRDCDIFYRYFGLNGYKREKSKDIAKSYGMSEGNIRNGFINKIIAYLKNDKKAMEILSNLQTLYNESLMVEMFGYDSEIIKETLLNDDVYVLLEELNRWNNKDIFKRAIEGSLENNPDKNIIEKLLVGDFEELDNLFKKYKKSIILFLSNMYPSENMNRKTDVSLLEYMEELQKLYKKYYNK